MLNPITLVAVEIFPAPILASTIATVFSDLKFAFAFAPVPLPPDSIVTEDKIFFSATVVKYWLPSPNVVILIVLTPARALL